MLGSKEGSKEGGERGRVGKERPAYTSRLLVVATTTYFSLHTCRLSLLAVDRRPLVSGQCVGDRCAIILPRIPRRVRALSSRVL